MNSAIVWQIHRMPCALENYTASRYESERSERSDTEDLTDERFKVAQEPSSRNRSQEDASEEGCAARILTAPVASDIRDQFVHKYNWEALEE